MELNQLHYFMVVASLEHITRASKELNIAQPALTKSMHNLEDELGIDLFENVGRNIKLTKWGRWLYDKLNNPLNQILKIDEEIKAIKNTKHIKISVNASTIFVTNAIIEFRKKYNDVTFSLVQGDDFDSDIIVSTSNIKKYDNSFIEKIYVAINKESKIDEFDLSKINNYSLITLTEVKMFRKICDDFLANNGIMLKPFFECDNVISVHDLIKSGNGIGFWPEYSWGKLNSDIKLIEIKNIIFNRYISIIKNDISFYNQDVLNKFFNYLNLCFKNKRIIELKE